jgi:membrane associated rhomboid family serine protease
MVGASGAIYGVLLAFGLTYPDVRLILFPFFIPIRAKYLVLILGAMAIYSALERAEGDNVAHLAHLGGMAVGYVMVRLWRARDEQPWQRWN